LRVLPPSEYRVIPWKNGQGTTTELFRADGPDGEIDWRVSVASVATDGPFSLFPGYDRHIMTIKGHGMTLYGGPNGPIAVNPDFSPAHFSGDWPVSAHLRDGPISDFNLIARRSAFDSNLACQELTSRFLAGADGSSRLFQVLSGNVLINGQVIREGWSCTLGIGEAVAADSASPQARIAICTLRPRS
jgi:uncharacterized protein